MGWHGTSVVTKVEFKLLQAMSAAVKNQTSVVTKVEFKYFFDPSISAA